MLPTLPSHARGARSLQPKSSSCLENCGAKSPAGKEAAKAVWASGHGVYTGAEKPEVRLGSGFPEGETIPKAMNAAGSGAAFCKYLGILRNLKKNQVRGRNFLQTRGFAKSQIRGQRSAGCSMLPATLSWGAALGLPEGAAPATAPQEQRGPARSRGEVWAAPTTQTRCVEIPRRWRIKAWYSG